MAAHVNAFIWAYKRGQSTSTELKGVGLFSGWAYYRGLLVTYRCGVHRLQLSRNLRDSPGFVDFVPGPGRLYYLSRMWARQLSQHTVYAVFALLRCCNGTPISPERLSKSKKATVLCLNHESLHTSTLITNLWAWFIGVANMAHGLWAWSVGVALVPEGSQKKLEPMGVISAKLRQCHTNIVSRKTRFRYG